MAATVLAKKINILRPAGMTVEEISVETKKNGVQVSFSLLRSLMSGNSRNPTRDKLLALAKTLEAPVRYLADDGAETPLAAVIAEAKVLSSDDQQSLINALQVAH